jgi:hypothetical protein
LDLGLKQNIIFYAKFLALYAAKMKRDWVQNEKIFMVLV